MSDSLLRVIPEGQLQKSEANQADKASQLENPTDEMSALAAHIRGRWDLFRRHRTEVLNTATSDTTFNVNNNVDTLNGRLLSALRSYQGKYNPQKLAEISRFGGSTVFSKLTTIKCRGATALLKDIFVNGGRTWDLAPTPNPAVPEEVNDNIGQLVQLEAQHLAQAGQPVDDNALAERQAQLEDAASKAAVKRAKDEAREATDHLDDFLVEGNFYRALSEFLVDLPIFYLACIKGPVVRMVKDISWRGGQMMSVLRPKMFWQRTSPFDLYWTPGATCLQDAEVIEKVRYTRADLNALLNVPGYSNEAIRAVLDTYGDGYSEYPDEFESQRSDLESREDFHLNRSGLIEGLEFHGSVQGKKLIDEGIVTDKKIDPVLDYTVTAWVIGRWVIKAQINPNPRERHGYYSTSFEKVPGSIAGNGVPDIIDDIQDVANASLRSLVNNMSIASGPQVAVNEGRLGPNTDPDSMYPWKRWRFEDDPMGNPAPPITFFQPNSNARELLEVFQAMTTLADEISAIPRYLTGSNNVGGAASTASGLSMLMNNASKVLQNIAAQIDEDIFEPLLEDLYDFVMLTDGSGKLKGDENIQVRGVTMAIQKEQDRMRRLEFLQITGNPIDSQIVGPKGRAAILRTIADDLSMPGEEIVPTQQELEAQQQQQQQLLVEQQAAAEQAANAPKPGQQPRASQEFDNNFRTSA